MCQWGTALILLLACCGIAFILNECPARGALSKHDQAPEHLSILLKVPEIGMQLNAGSCPAVYFTVLQMMFCETTWEYVIRFDSILGQKIHNWTSRISEASKIECCFRSSACIRLPILTMQWQVYMQSKMCFPHTLQHETTTKVVHIIWCKCLGLVYKRVVTCFHQDVRAICTRDSPGRSLWMSRFPWVVIWILTLKSFAKLWSLLWSLLTTKVQRGESKDPVNSIRRNGKKWSYQ
jgi:hypothetical protein